MTDDIFKDTLTPRVNTVNSRNRKERFRDHVQTGTEFNNSPNSRQLS